MQTKPLDRIMLVFVLNEGLLVFIMYWRACREEFWNPYGDFEEIRVAFWSFSHR